MQQAQHIAAKPRQRFVSAAAALVGALLMSACVSGTSGDTACKNTTPEAPLAGEIKGSVVVPRGATCHLKANVAGDVNAQDGARVYVLAGTRIGGTFRAVGASLVRFNLDNGPQLAATGTAGRGARPATSTVSDVAAAPAKISVGSNLIIKESHLTGESGIAATDIGGNLVIARNSNAAKLDAAAVPGSVKVCTPGMCREGLGVTVGKSVKIKQNQVAVAINHTRVGADLKCSSNDQPPVLLKADGADNHFSVKGRRSGQCERIREVVMAPAATAVASAPPATSAR